MVIGALAIEAFFSIIIGIALLVLMAVILWYLLRGLLWVLKFFWKDNVVWFEGEMKRAWEDRPFQRRPRKPYFPAEVEQEVERRLRFRLQELLDKSREQDKPRQLGRDFEDKERGIPDGKAGRQAGGEGYEGDNEDGGGTEEGVG